MVAHSVFHCRANLTRRHRRLQVLLHPVRRQIGSAEPDGSWDKEGLEVSSAEVVALVGAALVEAALVEGALVGAKAIDWHSSWLTEGHKAAGLVGRDNSEADAASACRDLAPAQGTQTKRRTCQKLATSKVGRRVDKVHLAVAVREASAGGPDDKARILWVGVAPVVPARCAKLSAAGWRCACKAEMPGNRGRKAAPRALTTVGSQLKVALEDGRRDAAKEWEWVCCRTGPGASARDLGDRAGVGGVAKVRRAVRKDGSRAVAAVQPGNQAAEPIKGGRAAVRVGSRALAQARTKGAMCLRPINPAPSRLRAAANSHHRTHSPARAAGAVL